MKFKKLLMAIAILGPLLFFLAPATATQYPGDNPFTASHHWPLNETSGLSAPNVLNSSFGLSVDSSAAWLNSGRWGEGYNSQDSFSLNNDTGINFGTGGSRTISIWINVSSYGSCSDGAPCTIFDWNDGVDVWQLRIRSSGQLSFVVSDDGFGNFGTWTDDAALVVTSKWMHFLFTKDFGDGDSLVLWINGTNRTGTWSDDAGQGRDVTESNYDDFLISDHQGGSQTFAGSVDDIVLFYKRANNSMAVNMFNGNYSVPPPAEPSLGYSDPTPSNLTNTSNNFINWNLSFTNTSALTNISLEFFNTAGLINRSTTTTENPFARNFTNLADGTYYIQGIAFQDDGQNATVGNRTITIDTKPPNAVTNLNAFNFTRTTINWNWNNPVDSDFNDSIVFINGTIKAHTTGNSFQFVGAGCGQDYNISVQTRDNLGNINTTLRNNTQGTAACIKIGDNLELYYEFNVFDGGPYLDATDRGHTGIATGIPKQVGGLQGFGVGFEGTVDTFINSTFNLTNSSWSLQTWINFDTFNAAKNNIWSAKSDTGTGISLWYNTTASALELEMHNESGSLCQDGPIVNTNLNTGTWYHTILTFNGSQGILYLNGAEVNITANCVARSFSDLVTIDRFHRGSGNAGESDGTFDEFAIWSRLLAANEVTSLFNGGAGRSFTFINSGGVSTSDLLFTVGIPSNVTISLTHNSTTGLITYTWTDAGSQIDGGYFDVIVYNSSGAFLNQRNAASGSSGALTQNITTFIDNGWSVYAIAFLNDSFRVYISGDTVAVGTLFVSPPPTITDVIPVIDGAMFGFFITLLITTFGLFLKSPAVTVVGMIFGLISAGTVFIDLNLAFIATGVVMAIIILWVLSKTR